MTERDAPLHLPTENSGECSACFLPWPCPVAIAWEQAHSVFCPRASRGLDVCSTHLRPGDRYAHQRVIPPATTEESSDG